MPRHHPDPRQQLDALREQREAAVNAVTEAQRAVETAVREHRFTGHERERLTACIQRHREVERLLEALQQRLDRDQADAAGRRAAELGEQIGASIAECLKKFPAAVLPEIRL